MWPSREDINDLEGTWTEIFVKPIEVSASCLLNATRWQYRLSKL